MAYWEAPYREEVAAIRAAVEARVAALEATGRDHKAEIRALERGWEKLEYGAEVWAKEQRRRRDPDQRALADM